MFLGMRPKNEKLLAQVKEMNRPGFAGELLVQILGCFFSRVEGFVEILFCFLWRDVSDFTV